MRVLIVEDDENRLKWFRQALIGVQIDVTKDTVEACRLIDTHEYTQIFLDHDLSDEHYTAYFKNEIPDDSTTGYAVANHLAMYPQKSEDAEIIVHSLNPAGSDRMWRRMRETRRSVRKVNFLQLRGNP